jgi:fatty-acid desaturase
VPDEHSFTLRQVDQTRTDFAAIESDLEFLMQHISQLPTASDLWLATLLIAFVAAVLGIVGIEAFWHYFPACGSI